MMRQTLPPSRERRVLIVANNDQQHAQHATTSPAAPQPGDALVQQLAAERLDPSQARDGERVKSDDGQTLYRAEHHRGGKVTFHRAVPKLSKADKKRAKKARHQQRNDERTRAFLAANPGFLHDYLK